MSGLGDDMQTLVRPAFLLHDPSLDEPGGRHPLQLLVQLVRRGHPEVGDRGVEALGEVVSGGLSVQQGGKDRIA